MAGLGSPPSEGLGEVPTSTFSPCQHFSSLLFIVHALQGGRRGPSTFENMPFLHAEKALLEAWRASSRMLFVICWLLGGYDIGERGGYTLVLRVFNSILCNVFSWFNRYSPRCGMGCLKHYSSGCINPWKAYQWVFFYCFQMLCRGFVHTMLRLRMIEKDGYERIILGQSCERQTLLSWRKYSIYGQGKRSFCYMRRSEKGDRLIH